MAHSKESPKRRLMSGLLLRVSRVKGEGYTGSPYSNGKSHHHPSQKW